jgi:hypothetical protein
MTVIAMRLPVASGDRLKPMLPQAVEFCAEKSPKR